MPIRLIIIDDHTLFREGIKALLSTTTDIKVVGEASDSAGGIKLFLELRPQVVLMDINMPGMSGIDATRSMIEMNDRVGVIMVTMQEDDASIFSAMRAGARGYVLKGANPQEMLEVIRAVAEGQALFGPAIAARMVRFFKEMRTDASDRIDKRKHQLDDDNNLNELTEREREVLDLIAGSYNNVEIANKLVISPKTVRNHITSIFSKLQVADRAEAIRYARRKNKGASGQPDG
jgi:DNA-binding NarL/FixJ family response regulator